MTVVLISDTILCFGSLVVLQSGTETFNHLFFKEGELTDKTNLIVFYRRPFKNRIPILAGRILALSEIISNALQEP